MTTTYVDLEAEGGWAQCARCGLHAERVPRYYQDQASETRVASEPCVRCGSHDITWLGYVEDRLRRV